MERPGGSISWLSLSALVLLLASCTAQQAPDGKARKRAPASVRLTNLEVSANAILVLSARDARFDTEQYAVVSEEGFLDVTRHPLSTFSVDVDTASYANVRRILREGRLPAKGAVRIEEFLNYFDYDYPDAAGDAPFSIVTETMPAPWEPAHQLLMVGLQGRRIEEIDLPPRNLTFLLDVSGSMQPSDKLPLVVRAMTTLVAGLRPEDHVAIVVYASDTGVLLPPTSGADRATITSALDRLRAGGATNGAGGIAQAYALAREHFDPNGVNRVILATDGDFNVGVSSQSELVELIERERESGVFLTVLGVGMGNLKDDTMEKLADHGNGNYAYLDTLSEARKVLVREAGGTLVTIAKDVKLQLEFNPQHVAGYRLIGYENRRLADEDFNDDAKDAGEIGAGHTVTALYEIVPAGQPVPAGDVDPLRYQQPPAAPGAESAADFRGELLTLKLRYKAPDGRESKLLTRHVEASDAERTASRDLRFASAVATFGLMLRESPFRSQASYDLAFELARESVGADPQGYRSELVALIAQARDLRAAEADRPMLGVQR